MTWRGFNLWHLVLLAVNCLLLVVIVRVWWQDDAPTLPTRAGTGPTVPTAPIIRDQQPMSAFQVVAAKNLFTQDRSGPDQKAPASAKGEDTLEGRQLLGIIIIGEERAAILSGKQGKGRQESPAEVVRRGEEWEGLQVVEISNEAVIFQGKDGKKTLNFPE